VERQPSPCHFDSPSSPGENPAPSSIKRAMAAALSFPPWGRRFGVLVHAYVLPMLICLAAAGVVDVEVAASRLFLYVGVAAPD
jgi:hypothetical protein